MKKVMMKRVTIALVIVCAILAYFFTLGFYLYSIEMTNKYDSLVDEYDEVIDDYNRLVQRYNELIEGAATPPYVQIENRTVYAVFKASDETLHRWSVPLDSLEASVKLGYYKRELIPEIFMPMLDGLYNWYYEVCVSIQTLYAYYGQTVDFSNALGDFRDVIENWRSESLQYVDLEDSETGQIHHVIDYRPFVMENSFSTVMSDLYYELNSNDESFVHEVWYIVTQLTTYHPEIEETPRFPLETMMGGGGDCEDLAILIANMLKAAPANYVVELVYMDSDNPTDPENINHVTVWVETPSGYKTFVEGTSHTEMCPFTLVEGWHLEV